MTRVVVGLSVLIWIRARVCYRPTQWNAAMPALRTKAEIIAPALLPLRFEVREAAQILRMSRAQLYNRIHDGSLKPQKDGARTYITRVELERYVQACGT